MAQRMFGTNGVRGVVNDDMNTDLALQMGKAIGKFFGGKVAIATDTRVSGDMIKSAVCAGLMSVGCDVRDLGIVPTPAIQYHIKTSDKIVGGVMITASHNPPEFNGIKCIDFDGTEMPREKEEKIEILYAGKINTMPWNEIGVLETYEGADDENCVYFTFEFATEYDAALGLERELGYRITGLTDLGKAQTTLTVPVGYNGYRVTLLGEGALAGGSCRTLVLPDTLNALAEGDGIVFTFERGSFEGASNLRRLDMYVDNPKCVQPPNLAGVHTPLPVHVKADSYFLYDSDYYWVQIKGDITLVGDLD